ncbi:MAG: hypothetical protein NTW99_05395 [Chloroflexi bacterium]|nr:hypothetical protein [Chloroflexota bacterium]
MNGHRGPNTIAHGDGCLPEYAILDVTDKVEDAPIFEFGRASQQGSGDEVQVRIPADGTDQMIGMQDQRTDRARTFHCQPARGLISQSDDGCARAVLNVGAGQRLLPEQGQAFDLLPCVQDRYVISFSQVEGIVESCVAGADDDDLLPAEIQQPGDLVDDPFPQRLRDREAGQKAGMRARCDYCRPGPDYPVRGSGPEQASSPVELPHCLGNDLHASHRGLGQEYPHQVRAG